MNTNRNVETPAGFSPADVYFVVFRHKWKIIVLTLLGLAAATVLHFTQQPPYQSQAELLIQYVPAAGAMSLSGSDRQVIVPDSMGQDIINSEILILTSLDLMEQAVTNLAAANLGPAKILGKGAGSNDIISAALLLRNNLKAEPATKGGSVIGITFKHSDPQIVQPVLQELITTYLQRHQEIHSPGGQFDDVLTTEGANLNNQLEETERQLAGLKNQAGIISLDDSKKGLAEQIAKTQADIMEAQAVLAGYEAAAKQSGSTVPETPAATNTNAPTVIPADQSDAYKDICAQLDQFRKQRRDYIGQGYTGSNTLVQEVEGRIARAQETKTGLEAKYPQISSLGGAAPADGAGLATPMPATDPHVQASQMASLQARLKAWGMQLDRLQMQATNLNTLAPAIAHLEQARSIQQANYQNLATKLANSHVDEALDTGKTPNIKWVESPTPPFQDWRKTQKMVFMAAFSGLLAGLLWAFLIEFYLDRSVKRPEDVLIKLRMPFSLSIPDLNRQGRRALVGMAPPARPQLAFDGSPTNGSGANGSSASDGSAVGGSVEVVPPSPAVNPALHPHCDALRDRLVSYFESINLTRKPKLVALTSANRGAGVSALSAGLAASLSETGDGRVLLVDMNRENGAAHQFIHGQVGCQLDDALSSDKRDHAQVQENLYVVSEGSNADKLPRILPKRFAALMPKLRCSDYDYIIFDMPPVSQTSVTTRLAGFMDTVLLVIESEKTDRDAVQQANQLLLQSKTHVSAVLNKTRNYVPARLLHDINAG